jgi:hypothetical protein
MSKCIIFLDGEILGYLDDEIYAKKAVSDLADKLIENIKTTSSVNQRISRENIDTGIKVYTQNIGTFMEGFVYLKHVITWKIITKYE